MGAGHDRRLDVLVAVLCLAGATLIVAKSLLDADGYLSPDSTNYLSLVENLKAGRGLVTPNSGRVDAPFTPFAEWPVGYPLLIYVVGGLTGLSAFAASKGVSVVLFLGTAVAIVRSFSRDFIVLACVPCFAATVELFSYTWSEVSFTFGLVVLAALVGNALRAEDDLGTAAALSACGLWLFLSRYIGAFALGVIGLLWLLALIRRRWRQALWLALAGALLASSIGAYLWHNYLLTGFPTGMQRPAATTPAPILARELLRAVTGELALVSPPGTLSTAAEVALAVIMLGGLVALLVGARELAADRGRDRTTAWAFVAVGALYLAAIVGMRWFMAFDPFDFRLLDPAFVPLLTGLFGLALSGQAAWPRRAATVALPALAAISLAAQADVAFTRADHPGYLEHARTVQLRYATIPPGATVVFGDRLARFLRPDLHIDAPCTEQGEDCNASWETYLDNLTEGREIYADIGPDALDADHHSPSVRAFVASHQPGSLVRVR
jgi:hypothetical protein